MFGYVVTNKDQLNKEEEDIYQSYYCGLCHTLKENHGNISRLSLNYDMTFLVLLLTGVYEPSTTVKEKRCALHPINTRIFRQNIFSDYAAQMTIVLSYFKCEDDWNDNHSHNRKLMMKLLEKEYRKVYNQYPQKCKRIEQSLHIINEYEKQNVMNVDLMANTFGKVMGEIVAYRDDEWYDELYQLGYNLGKYIYLIDAYEDVEKDIKHNDYNFFKERYKEEGFDDYVKNILELFMSEATLFEEKLPILENDEILKNILYSGVWTKYEIIKQKRNKEKQR